MRQSDHIPALDGLRGFAALIVLLSHMHMVGLPQLTNRHLGDYGVLIFFMLSGFLMGHLYLAGPPDRKSLVHYASARFARVVPFYTIVVIGAFLIARVVPGFIYPLDPTDLLRALTFTSQLPIFWSIGPEVQFYLLFPMGWIALYAPRRHRTALLFCLLCEIVAIIAISPAAPGFSALSKLHIFMAGILIALARRHCGVMRARRYALPVHMLALALLALLLVPPAGWQPWIYSSVSGDPKHLAYYGDPLKIAAMAIVLIGATMPGPLMEVALANPAARKLGAISFSFYLLHLPCLYLLTRVVDIASWPPVAAALASIALAVSVSALSYRLIEKPLHNRCRQVLARFMRRRLGGSPLQRIGQSA